MKYWIIWPTSIALITEHPKHIWLDLIPIAIRLAIAIAIASAHHVFHRVGHHWLEHKLKAWRYLPDALMILALVTIHLTTEG